MNRPLSNDGPARRGRRRPDLQKVGSVLDAVIDSLGLTQRLEGQRAIALWPEVAGKGVAAHAEAKEFRDGRLVVAVDGSVWIQELSLRRRELVDSLNARLADRASPSERRARGVVRELLFVAREPRTRQG